MISKRELYSKKMIVNYKSYAEYDQPICDWNDERFGKFQKELRLLMQEYCDENQEGEIIQGVSITWENDTNSEDSK